MSSKNQIYQPYNLPFKRNKNKVLHGNKCRVGKDNIIYPLYTSASVTQYKNVDGNMYSEEFNVMDAKRCVDEITHL